MSEKSRRSLKIILGTLVGVLSLLLLCSGLFWLFIHRFDPPGIWRNPPIYPEAQNVSIQDFGEWGKRLMDRENFYLVKVITYTVQAEKAKVEEFYVRNLGSWQPSTWGKLDPKSASITYEWSSNEARAPSVYFLDIDTKRSPSGGITVQIAVLMFPGY